MSATFIRPKASLTSDVAENLKTQGEIEAAMCDGMARIEATMMGRGPQDIRAHLIGDLLLIRLKCALTSAERHLASAFSDSKGRELLKQLRSQLIEVARPNLESLVRDITGVTLRSLHHDISTRTGEEVVILTLTDTPHFRENKKR